MRYLRNVPVLAENDMQDASTFGGLDFEVLEFEAETLPELRVVQNFLFAPVNPWCESVFLVVVLIHALLEVVFYALFEFGEGVSML